MKNFINNIKQSKFCLFMAKVGRIISKYYKLLGLHILHFIQSHPFILIGTIATILSLVAKYKVALYPTNDIAGIVFSWMYQIQDVGLGNFYKVPVDYSPIYIFMIGLFTLLPEGQMITSSGFTFPANWMYYLKTTMFICDILIAYGGMLIVKHITKDTTKGFLAYLVLLALPVQFVDSAIWGNCDSYYMACFVFILYCILKRKDGLAFFLFGIAFSIKLQAVFILPFLVYLILNRRLKAYKCIYALIGLMITFIPSWCCGASFTQPFEFITTQLGRFHNLTLGCANMWHLMNFWDIDIINKGSTWIGLLLIGVFLAIIYIRNIELTDKNLVMICTFLSSIPVFFLPHMHERYFYVLDCFIVLYVLVKGRSYFLVALMQVSSGIAYYHYLSGKYFIASWGEDSVHIAAFINLFVLSFIFNDLLKLNHKDSFLTSKQEIEKEITELKN